MRFLLTELGVIGTLFCGAGEIVDNGGFESGLAGWQLRGNKSSIDEKNAVEGKNSLKTSVGKPQWNRFFRSVPLEPDTEYILSFYLKCENVQANDAKTGGVIINLNGKDGKTLGYGTGFWKHASGTFDWKKFEFKFNSGSLGNPEKAELQGMLSMNASGTFWIDVLSIRKAGAAAEKKSPDSYKIELFPQNFHGDNQLGVCQNLPGVIAVLSSGKGDFTGKSATMTLELPDFLQLDTVCEGFPVTRNGKGVQLPCKVKKSEVRRNGETRQRCEVTFDRYFLVWLGQSWYPHYIVLSARPGAVGRAGKVFWSFDIGGMKQKEQDFSVKILPEAAPVSAPCERFALFLARSIPRSVNAGAAAERSHAFWSSLSKKCYRVAGNRYETEASYPGFEPMAAAHGNDFGTVFNRARCNELRKKMPIDCNADGKPHKYGSVSVWAMVDDPAGTYDRYMRENLRELRGKYPDMKIIWWDFEPGATGFDEGGRKRFAEKMKLDKVPTGEEILRKYSEPYFRYMVKLHAELIAKNAKLVREELPGVQFCLVSDNLHASPPHVARWCAVDVTMSDKEIDLHMHMPYYSGARYFDDVAYNVKNLKKPFFPLVDPAERLECFFKQYTPEKLEQNIVATAALGGVGIGFWPDDVLDGSYFHAIRSGFDKVSRNEKFYFDGKRCDGKIGITPKNVVSRKLSEQKTVMFPDFSKSIRCTAHELDGKIRVTLFNYDEKNPLIAEVSGEGFAPFLIRIPPGGCETADVSAPPPQKALQEEISRFGGDAGRFRDVIDGADKVCWDADSSGRPLLVMSNSGLSAGIDPFGACELVSLKNASGSELFHDGFGGRVMLHDPLQPKLNFQLVKFGVERRRPYILSEAEVGAYDGANPEPNPLYKMKIFRRIELVGNTVELTVRLFNPTLKAMPLSFRLNNFPAPGARFKAGRLELESDGAGFSADAPENILLFREGKRTGFMKGTTASEWKGGAVKLTAEAGNLSERLVFVPLSDFAGIYSWTQKAAFPRKTVEFISHEAQLAPGKAETFRYRISF